MNQDENMANKFNKLFIKYFMSINLKKQYF